MSTLSTVLAPAVIAAGLAGAWVQTPVESVAKNGPVHPVAALAWAQANCDSMLTAREGTPRVQAEDLMRVASMFDKLRAHDGDAVACLRATRLASRVAALHDDSAPASMRALLIALNLAK